MYGQYTPPKKFQVSYGPIVTAVIVIIFSETLSVGPCVLTIEVSDVLKGISRFVNSNHWQWAWKYLIIRIRLFNAWLRCNTLSTKILFFNSTSDSSKM